MKHYYSSYYPHWIKRTLDLILTVPAYLFFSPFIILIGLFIYFTLGKPVLFKQVRPGLHGKPFKIYKFRTMKHAYDDKGHPLPDADRLTNLGKFLRSTSLDELPELINVINGDMSIVGPRPLLMQYLDRYSPEQARRHDVIPGLTGWAQINGRNAISWEEKFKFDIWYVDNRGLWLDVKIIGMTVLKVLRRDGISQDDHATAQEFLGQNSRKKTQESQKG